MCRGGCVRPFGMADAEESEGYHLDLRVDAVHEPELDVIDLDVISDVEEVVSPP